jgi:hypothetical protein
MRINDIHIIGGALAPGSNEFMGRGHTWFPLPVQLNATSTPIPEKVNEDEHGELTDGDFTPVTA